MTDEKLYLLAELLVKPEALDETKAIFAKLLPVVRQEPGCEAMYTTTVDGNPTKLIFFEVFSSEEAHRFHIWRKHIRTNSVLICKASFLHRGR